MRAAFFVLACFVAVCRAANFYIPGVMPIEHDDGDQINITVNSLRSLQTIVPFDYYHLPFCAPAVRSSVGTESMGQILAGDRMESSSYTVYMKKDEKCVKVACPANNADQVRVRADEVTKFIEQGYRGHMSIDNLPGFNNGTRMYSGNCEHWRSDWPERSVRGYALGVPSWCMGKTLLNNHLEFTIKYHKREESGRVVVVGFAIVPKSVGYSDGIECTEAYDATASHPNLEMDLVKSGEQKVTWTYSVTWIEDPVVTWATRWDSYLNTSEADSSPTVHWKYIINSLLITLCLCAIASIMLRRTLHKDCNDYNAQDESSLAEDVGWKLVHADVFRAPPKVQLLAIGVGNGVQFVLVAVALLLFALLGFLSPANRGGLLTACVITFALFSISSGYLCARVLRAVDKKEWKVIFGSAMFFPGTLFGMFLIIDIINWHLGASDAVPFKNIALLFLLWVGSCIPLNVLGAAYGFHQQPAENPCSVGRLPREIPVQKWYLTAPWVYILPATFPFCAVSLELKFIFDSLWLGIVYYAFTFLALSFVVWVITVMLTTINVVYYLLAYGDYRWWWHSFLIAGSMGFHVLLYSVYFYFSEAAITSKTGTFIYFTYMGYFSLAYGLAAGAIGFLTTYVFVRKIYSSIRID
jgi:transmembrane 9 superfamily protein 2/4